MWDFFIILWKTSDRNLRFVPFWRFWKLLLTLEDFYNREVDEKRREEREREIPRARNGADWDFCVCVCVFYGKKRRAKLLHYKTIKISRTSQSHCNAFPLIRTYMDTSYIIHHTCTCTSVFAINNEYGSPPADHCSSPGHLGPRLGMGPRDWKISPKKAGVW